MTLKRIKKLADFFYSSDNANDVPLRLSVISGQFSGYDLDYDQCTELLSILSSSKNLKQDLLDFRTRLD